MFIRKGERMLGIVLVGHGELPKAMLAVVEHVVGNTEGMTYVCIADTDDMEEKRHEILDKTILVDTGDGVIVATDMFGGTPSNLAISLMEERNIEVISGMNVPMLIKLAEERSETMQTAVKHAQEAGRKYINVASNLL